MTTATATTKGYGKAQLLDDLATVFPELGRNKLGDVLETTFNLITMQVQAGERVVIPGFGVWQASERAERRGTHPQTHERLVVPAQRGVRFTAGSTFKQAVARKAENAQYARERGG